MQNIGSLTNKKLLKNVFHDVYENLTDYNLSMYNGLTKKIFSETNNSMDNFTIYTSMDYIENIDPVSGFLHPIILEDVKPALKLSDFSNNNPSPIIASVFMKCSNNELTHFLNEKKVYKGVIKTNHNTHEINATAKRCNKYVEQIEMLYRTFQKNNIAWTTINCPYAYKFIDIVLVSPLNLAQDETVSEVTINLGSYEQYKHINVVPLWNIKTLKTKGHPIPMPAIDRINYEYHISLVESGLSNGYMFSLNNPDFLYMIRRNHEYGDEFGYEIVAVAEYGEHKHWELLQVESISNLKGKMTTFEMVTNKRGFGSAKSIVIQTRSELESILKSYEQSKTVSFQDVKIIESNSMTKKTIDYNSFIDGNIRIDTSKPIMLLKFIVSGGEPYLEYDKISFLVSEIQTLFPEYNCIGELM